jgi:hypothetical protein
MKEKRAPSSQSKWGCFGLFVAVFMSCASIWWLGAINPYSAPGRFSLWHMSWDSEHQSLTFLQRSLDKTAYILDKEGHLTCVNRQVAQEQPDLFLVQEQYTSLEQRYGKISDHRLFKGGVVALIVIDSGQFALPDNYNLRLLLLRDVNDASPRIIDARMLYQAEIGCNNSGSSFIFCGGLFIVCATISVMMICRLRYKYLWLCAFVMLLLIGFAVGYYLSFFRGAGYDL